MMKISKTDASNMEFVSLIKFYLEKSWLILGNSLPVMSNNHVWFRQWAKHLSEARMVADNLEIDLLLSQDVPVAESFVEWM